MNYDPKVPCQLKKLQQWFGSIVGRPIDEDSRMDHISPSGESMEIEAAGYIIASPTLRPAQRIQIYNQQYWWRLLGVLHDGFPFLIRLLGYYEFNRNIGIPYLVKYPPNHWSLFQLGERLPQWIDENYHAIDRELVLHAAKIDWEFNVSFIIEQQPPLTADLISTPEKMETILEKVLFLQPHVSLFVMPKNLFQFRTALMEQLPEYWVTTHFPVCESAKTYYFIIYRNFHQEVSWKETTAGEYQLLSLLKKGTTIDAACDWLENQERALSKEVEDNLLNWFKDWTTRGWLTLNEKNLEINPDHFACHLEISK